MVRLRTSRLDTGRPPEAKDTGLSRVGKWIGAFSGPRDGVGRDEGERPAPRAVIFLSPGRSPGQGKSNLVQVKVFTAETRRRGENARWERKPRSGRRCPAALAGLTPNSATWRLGVMKVRFSTLVRLSPTWSKQKYFPGPAGAGGEPPLRLGAYSGSAGLLSNIDEWRRPPSAGGSCHASAPAPVRGGSHIYIVRHRGPQELPIDREFLSRNLRQTYRDSE